MAGAGVFVTTVVAGGIALVKPFTAASRPFLRDVIFYMVAVFLTFMVLYFGRITLGEALGECHGGLGGWQEQPGSAVTPHCSPHPRLPGAVCFLCLHCGALHLDSPAAAERRAGPPQTLGAR